MDNDKLNGKKLASFLIEKRNDSVIAFRSKKKINNYALVFGYYKYF